MKPYLVCHKAAYPLEVLPLLPEKWRITRKNAAGFGYWLDYPDFYALGRYCTDTFGLGHVYEDYPNLPHQEIAQDRNWVAFHEYGTYHFRRSEDHLVFYLRFHNVEGP